MIKATATMVLDGTPGDYSTTEIVLGAVSIPAEGNPTQAASAMLDPITGVSAVVESVSVSVNAVLELWLLRVGGDPATAGDWEGPVTTGTFPLTTAAKGSFAQALLNGGWAGVKLRAKNGAAGAGNIHVSAYAVNVGEVH